jgi:outer membrane protein assembly factor BamD
MRRRAWLLALLAATFAVGCAGKRQVVPPERLWSEATEAFEEEAWELAIERYKALLDQHPFDAKAEEAELRIGQAYYLARRYPEAIAAFGDFERMHPTSPSLPLVEYHLGLSHLAQASTSDRDQQAYVNGLTYFRNVVDRFPTSPWADRARLRMRECREALAAHERAVAAYYLRQGNLKAAEARLRGLLTEYPDTEATAETLYAFAQEYARRDEPEGATLALATLAHHHAEGRLGRDARRRLGENGLPDLDGRDPLPLLLGRIDRMRLEAVRQHAPPTVSAYPEIGGADGGRF